MHDCFISYSRKETPLAIAIQSLLEQNGIRCWIDFRDATPGVDYAASIVRAIRKIPIFVLVLSQNSMVSGHVLNEVNSAVNAGVTILPFKVDEGALNDSMEYYLGRTHWMDAVTPPLEKHVMRLVDTIHRHLEREGTTPIKRSVVASPRGANRMDCHMLKYQDLIELGYTSTTISLQLVENDYINCNGIGLENEGTAEHWESYLQNNSDTFQYLVNGENKIVGDWSIVALNEDSYEQAIKGEMLEDEIDLDKTEMICFPGIYNGYVLTFSILPEYRTMKNYNLIVESFLKQLEEYAENGIYFRRWCMNVFGKEVEAMIKQLGFRYETDNKVTGKIYSCDFMPLPQLPIYARHKKLVEEYANAQL